MSRPAVPLVWCILLVVAAWVMFDIVREAALRDALATLEREEG